MTPQKQNDNVTVWRFRRDISLGTIMNVLAIITVVMITWANLQKELALIHHNLNQLVDSNIKSQEHIENLTNQFIGHEFRIGSLEKQAQKRKISPGTAGQLEHNFPSG